MPDGGVSSANLYRQHRSDLLDSRLVAAMSQMCKQQYTHLICV